MTDEHDSRGPAAPREIPAPAPERVANRAAHLLPEERAAGGSADPRAQAEAILAESDRRTADPQAAPDSFLEHRTSAQAADH
ncbi:MAG TPA: hypothetical protein VNV66_06945 [Pilimelia sp.]|nr:hypothetical protein [Pilimelia sp.]